MVAAVGSTLDQGSVVDDSDRLVRVLRCVIVMVLRLFSHDVRQLISRCRKLWLFQLTAAAIGFVGCSNQLCLTIESLLAMSTQRNSATIVEQGHKTALL